MNEPLPPDGDPLLRATRALRQASEVRVDGQPAARSRILARAHAEKVGAERRAAVTLALSAVLVTSTAIAAATGTLPQLVAVFKRAVGVAPGEPALPAAAKAAAAGEPSGRRTANPMANAPTVVPIAEADASRTTDTCGGAARQADGQCAQAGGGARPASAPANAHTWSQRPGGESESAAGRGARTGVAAR